MPRRILPLLCLIALTISAGSGNLLAEEQDSRSKNEPRLDFFGAREFLPAKKALMDGDYEKALDLLANEMGGPFEEEALFRTGGILIQLDRHKEALTTLGRLITEYPKGRLFRKARFLKAEALVGLKRFDEASGIYEAEINHLISKDRKEEIAHYYIKYADAMAAKDREGGPQYEKAIELYRRALELEIPGAIDEEVRFKIASAYHKLERYGEEETVLAAFKKRHPESAALDEVEYRIGDARLRQNRFAEARKSFREFLRDHPDSRRVPEARYRIALTYNVPNPRTDTELSLGVKALGEFLAASADHELAPKARYQIGLSYMNRGRLDEAIGAYDEFVRIYGDKTGVEQLANVRFYLGACYYGQQKFPEALVAYKEFLSRHPAHELWDDAQRQIVVTEFEWGLSLIKAKEYEQARNRLLDFVRDYPLDERTPRAYLILGYLEADRKEYDAAIRDWERLVSKYPGSDLASEAQYKIGLTLETEFVKLNEALEAYKKVTYGSYADDAAARIALMSSKTLKVVTERAFTTREAPKVKITTRNIEELAMRFYRIDLEDYFVKRGTIFAVEDLDIDLIEPEKKWNAPVADFTRYAEISRDVDLPFTEPGAYVLNVSDDERTATALVLVTDLQMILKSGREDLLVYVENVAEKTPFVGAEVIVSSGKKVLFRGETGSDGVFHKADKTLRSSGNLSVLVANGGHFASNNLNLKGVAAAEGLKAKAYLFTDKTIYKPGHQVRIKGFVREVSQGRYTFTSGDAYTMTVYSPDGRAVSMRHEKCDVYGGLATDFVLAPSAPHGDYRIELKARAGWQATRTFTVGEYVPPRVTAVIDMKSDVYYQGEVVKGSFKVFYNYGEPARGKFVRYSYGTGVTLDGVVDDEGLVPFEIDTRDFGGAGQYPLVVEVLDEHAAAEKIIHISDTGFGLAVDLSRDVILSGEQITVEVKAQKPDGKPAKADAELHVIYLEEKDGVRTENELDTIGGIALDAETGRGTASVTLDKGGDYRLRFTANDRFGNLISAQKDLFVSGEEDKVRLRIFADSVTCDAGSDVDVRVHTRTAPGLGLLTCEGERIFHYEVVRFKSGDNTMPVKITPDLAPNFTFAVALMEGHRFHKAEIDLNVRSNLKVTVEPAEEEVEPGGKVKVKITARDRAGKPVAAQFALAAVDAALLARFPDDSSPIHEFFFGRKRKGRLKTDSSCTFAYKARTDMIDSAVQQEEMLRRMRTQEARSELSYLDVEEELEAIAMEDSISGSGGFVAGRGRKEKKAEADAPRAATTGGIAVSGGAGGRFGGRYDRKKRGTYKGPGDTALRKNLAQLGYNGGIAPPNLGSPGGPSAPGAAGPSARGPAGPTGLAMDKARAFHWRLKSKNKDLSAGDEAADARYAYEPAGEDFSLGQQVWFGRVIEEMDETVVRKRFLETAYWNPDVVTAADGTAEVEIALPDNTTTWKLVARGLTKETVGGAADAEVRARKTFFAELRTPLGLVEEDETLFVARLINTSDKKLTIDATLDLEGPIDGDARQTVRVDVEPGASVEQTFPVKAREPGLIKVKLEARSTGAGSGRVSDAVSGSLVVKPMGVEIYAGKGGTAAGSKTVTVALPEKKEYAHTYMEIAVGPSFADYLLHMANASYHFCCLPTFSDLASQVLVKLSVIDYLRRSGHSRTGASARLEREVANLLTTLLLAQKNDGGFPWIRSGEVSALATAQTLKALARARDMGFTVPETAAASAAVWIDKHQRKLSGDEKAFFLHAYSFYKAPEFTFLNSLFRKRNTLSDQGLALLSLAFRRSGHKDNAATLARMLIDRSGNRKQPWADLMKGSEIEDVRFWMCDEYMVAAQVVLAVELVEPNHPLVKKGIDFILNAGNAFRRTGPSHAAAAAALAEYVAGAGLADSRYTLAIVVNGKEVKKLDVAGPHPLTDITVPDDALTAGENEVAFRFEGRGEFTWAVKMSGFTKDVKPLDHRKTQAWITRQYLMAPLLYKGREVDSGFDTVRLPSGFRRWVHELEEINQGETALVKLEWSCARTGRNNRVHPLVITDTLPAGCTVIETGIKGRYDHYEIGPGTITFFTRGTRSSITYPIYAAHEGDYRSPPAVVRSTFDPSMSNFTKLFDLPIRERGAEKSAPYKMTPDEYYALGCALFDDKDAAGALENLEAFLGKYKKFTPRDKYLVDAASKLFRLAFDSGDNKRLISYFELLRERAPSLSLTFKETARVGEAYRARGEHEQALQIFALAAGSSFGREARVAQALEHQGEVAGSLMFLADLIRTYPDLPEIEAAFFALSQALLDKAGPAGGKPKIPGIPRKKIMAEAIGLLVDFLATYPQNPINDEAAYSLISTLLELEQNDEVIRLSPIFRERWPKSRFRSSMEYAEAYALFEAGRFDEATGLLTRVADLDPDKLDPEGRDNRDLAVYILGQIDHAGGRIARAIEHYRQVMKKFADAAEAVDFFTRKSVTLPEISTFRSGEDVKVELEYRNVPEVTLSVYKVDLMKLCLLRKNLNNVTDINLAGINPTVVKKIKLGDGKDYKKMKKKLELPLTAKGAYMVVVQGEAAGCTGMALIADLALEVQEDAGSGRVRVNVKDRDTGAFVKNVYVKVIGSRQTVFNTGYTDLRGVYIADGIEGTSTVIAEREGEYAFHRGLASLQEAPQRAAERSKQQELYFKGRDRALQNVFQENRRMQQQRGVQVLEGIYQEDNQNVQIK